LGNGVITFAGVGVFGGLFILFCLAIGLIMSELILDGKSSYDVSSIEADRYFDMPGYLDRDDIDAKCVSMAGNYYGKVERAAPVTVIFACVQSAGRSQMAAAFFNCALSFP